MNKTVALAKENGVLVGAHPSLPDPQGWGRREMAMEPVRAPSTACMLVLISCRMEDELASCFIYQVGALLGFLQVHGVPLNHVLTLLADGDAFI